MIKSIAAIVVAGTVCSAASAMITQTQNFDANPNFSGLSLTFNKYNGIDALASIEVIFDLDVVFGGVRIDNDGAEGVSDVIAEAGVQAGLTSSDVLLPGSFSSNVSATNNINLTVSADDGDAEVGGTPNFSVVGSDFAQVLGFTASGLNQSGFVNPAVFGLYSGPGTFDINVSATEVFSAAGLGGAQRQFDPSNVSGSVTVIYTFVPTPGAASLLGVAGLAATRRRR